MPRNLPTFLLMIEHNLVSAVTGCLAGDPLTDIVVALISKRRGRYFEPEFRLRCLIAPFIFGPIGILLKGCGLGKHLTCLVPAAGAGTTYGVLCAVPVIETTYVVDCYRAEAGETMTVVTASKNIFASRLSFAAVRWIEKPGYVKASSFTRVHA